jgi:hypothetical protein
MTRQTDDHDGYEGLHAPRAGLETHTSLTASPTRDALLGRQPVCLRDHRRRSSMAVGVSAVVTPVLDRNSGGACTCKEKDLGLERLVFG